MKTLRPTAAVAVLDFLFFALINPTRVNLFVVIIGCMLMAVTLYVICKWLLYGLSKVVSVSTSAQKQLALSLTISVMFLLLMQSIGQLSIRDILAMIPLAVLSYFYLGYTFKKRDNGNRSDRV